MSEKERAAMLRSIGGLFDRMLNMRAVFELAGLVVDARKLFDTDDDCADWLAARGVFMPADLAKFIREEFADRQNLLGHFSLSAVAALAETGRRDFVDQAIEMAAASARVDREVAERIIAGPIETVPGPPDPPRPDRPTDVA